MKVENIDVMGSIDKYGYAAKNLSDSFVSYNLFLTDNNNTPFYLYDRYINYFSDPYNRYKLKTENGVDYLHMTSIRDMGMSYAKEGESESFIYDFASWGLDSVPKVEVGKNFELIFQEEAYRYSGVTQYGAEPPYKDYLTIQYSKMEPVPEPSTFLLLGGGLSGLAWYRRKHKGE